MRGGGGYSAVEREGEGETAKYLDEAVSKDIAPESLDKGKVSLVTRRTLLALTDENAPAFREAFARGAIFTLNYPTQADINKLREILSLDAEQVISDDAVDPHVDIYALTFRTNGGGMMYKYIALSSANISFDMTSNDISQDTPESGDSALEVPASFQASEASEDVAEPEISDEEVAKQKVERFLTWTQNIDSIHESSIQSLREKRAEIEGAFSEADIFGDSITLDGSKGYIRITPTYLLGTFHSFRYGNDYYVVQLSEGGFRPLRDWDPDRDQSRDWRGKYVRGYASWYDISMWLGNERGSVNVPGIRVYERAPKNENHSYTYTKTVGWNVDGKVALNKSSTVAGNKKSSTTGGGGELGGGYNSGYTTQETRYDYYVADRYSRLGLNCVEWRYNLTPPKDVNDTPSVVSRETFTPLIEAAWEVKPDYWKNKNKRYVLTLYNAGKLGEKRRSGTSEYGLTSLQVPIELTPPPHVVADRYYVSFPASGGTKTINVNSSQQGGFTTRERLYNLDDKYSYGYSPIWLFVQGANTRYNDPTGEQSRPITITVPANTNRRGAAREAELTLIGRETNEQLFVLIRQEGR